MLKSDFDLVRGNLSGVAMLLKIPENQICLSLSRLKRHGNPFLAEKSELPRDI